MTYEAVIQRLKSLANPKNVEGMARFGINPTKTFGIPIPVLRKLAKEIGKDHIVAQELWDSGYHEARIIAGFIDDPKQVTGKQMDAWISDFDSWDVCDQVCANLFDKTSFAFDKAEEWSQRETEFEKRAGFALMACLAWHDKEANDEKFTSFFPLIKGGLVDRRNYVKKAVNWALRQIGKRNKKLNKEAIKLAREIQKVDSKPAKWIAIDALRELQDSKIQNKI